MNYEISDALFREIHARITAARAIADLIRDAMCEDGNKLTDALFGVVCLLRSIEETLGAITEDDGAEDEDETDLAKFSGNAG